MTVVPGTDGNGRSRSGTRSTLRLICDGCGFADSHVMLNSDMWPSLWQRSYRDGWSGTAWTFGPHYCSDCTGREQP